MPEKTAGAGSPQDLSTGAQMDGVATRCPCGHSSLQHSTGGGFGVSNPMSCDVKNCACSGFGNPPGQGRGWAYHGEKDYPGTTVKP